MPQSNPAILEEIARNEISLAEILSRYSRDGIDQLTAYEEGPGLSSSYGAEARFLWPIASTRKRRPEPFEAGSSSRRKHSRIIQATLGSGMPVQNCTAVQTSFGKARGFIVAESDIELAPRAESLEAVAAEAAEALPAFRRVIYDQRGISLDGLTAKLLRDACATGNGASSGPERLETALEEVCEGLAKGLGAAEATVLLRSPAGRNTYIVAGSNVTSQLKRLEYSAGQPGPTGHVLSTSATLLVPDISADWGKWGASWPVGLQPEDLLAASLKRIPVVYPPFSLLAVPIAIGPSLFGVLRLSIRTRAPHRFNRWDESLLSRIAHQIALAFSWAESEHRSYLSATRGRQVALDMTAASTAMRDALGRQDDFRDHACKDCLSILMRNVTAEDPILDVRLIDDETNELYFAATDGDAWHEGSETAARKRQRKRFSLESVEAASIGASYVSDGDPSVGVVVHHNPTEIEGYDETFEDVTVLALAKLASAGKTVGCIDLRLRGKSRLDDESLNYLTTVAQFLSIFIHAADLMELNAELHHQQEVVIEDFHHQVGGPAYAIARASEELDEFFQWLTEETENRGERGKLPTSWDQQGRYHVNMLQGLAGKLERVAELISTLKLLAEGEELPLSRVDMRSLDLQAVAARALKSVELATSASREIQFVMRGVEGRGRNYISVDEGLIEQVLHNAIDNAAKYCFDRTTVEVLVRDSRIGQVEIEVTNSGIGVGKSEERRVFGRYAQGEAAEMSRGDGRGIGLWLAKVIADAHGATVSIGTTQRDLTVFRLTIPSNN